MVYVATVNTHALYRYENGTNEVSLLDLYDVLPASTAMAQPRTKVVPMGRPLEGQVIMYDEKVRSLSERW